MWSTVLTVIVQVSARLIDLAGNSTVLAASIVGCVLTVIVQVSARLIDLAGVLI